MLPPVSEERTFHVERARAELDAAYRADRPAIAAIHLRLCALHMDRDRPQAEATDDQAGQESVFLPVL